MKTAIQQAIETIQSSLKNYEELLTNEPYNSFIAGRYAEKQGVIDYLTKLLPTEQDQIMTAYADGSLNKTEMIHNGKNKITAEEYYTETFKTDK